jgi:PAS domain S-box-containing protein
MKPEMLDPVNRETEQALAEGEQRYRRLLAATTDYLYSVRVEDGKACATEHGPGCKAVTGYTSEEFTADPFLWYRIIHHEDRAAVLEQAERILQGELPPPLEHRILHKEGEVRWILNTTIPHRNRDHQLIAYDGLITDITKRKRAEQFGKAEYNVVCILAESRTFADALPKILKVLCDTLLWHYAACWTCLPNRLRRQNAFWRIPAGDADFAGDTQERCLAPGTGLVGRVCLTGQPAWAADAAADSQLAPHLPAQNAGLHCGCAVSFRISRECTGVLELFSREVLKPDPELLNALFAIGAQIGQFLERKQVEEQLTEERNLLRILVDNLPDCIYVKDAAHRFLMSNAAHCKLLGAARPEDLLGKTDDDFFPPELAGRHRADEETLLQTRQPLLNQEELVADRRGNPLWFLCTKVPLKNADDKVVGLVGVGRDITERRHDQQALRESEERLALVIQGSNDGIWDWNLQTNATYFSPRWKAMLGYGSDEIPNTFAAWEALIHPDDLDRVHAQVQAYCAGRIPFYEVEHRLRHRDGTYRWILARGTVLRDAHGRPVRLVGSHMDLTERKNFAERLERANAKLAGRDRILKRMVRELKASQRELKQAQWKLIQAARLESVGTLSAGVAHEVKNPLQTIVMGLDYLAAKFPAPEDELGLTLRDMRDAAERADIIIREMLNLSAPTEFLLAPQNLNQLIEHSLHLVHNQLVRAQITVALDLAAQLPVVMADAAKLRQVLLNVLVNAIQAMPAGGSLRVRTRRLTVAAQSRAQDAFLQKFGNGETLVVAELHDSGPGISPADLPRIFDPFFTTKPVGVGTGLGLSVALKIIELHGGAIKIENAPAGGALVTIALKATEENAT